MLCVMPSHTLQGMERATLAIMRLLVERGARVHFVASRRYGPEVNAAILGIGATHSGLPFVPNPRLPASPQIALADLAHWSDVRREFHEVARAFGPTHLHATTETYALLASGLARRPDVRSVFRLPNPPGVGGSNWLHRTLRRQLWRRIAESYDRLVCNAEYTREVLITFAGSRRLPPVEVIRNIVPPRTSTDDRETPILNSSRRHVTYVGRLTREKGVGVLYEAAKLVVARYPDVDFVFAGAPAWQDPFGDQLVAQCRLEGLAERILFPGFISGIEQLLRQSTLHVCPSISPAESFPNVVLEAKQAGLPSVVFPTAGLPEAVREGEGVVCEGHSPAALVRGLCHLLDRPTLTRELGQRAQASLARHDPEYIAAHWTSLLREL